MDDQDHDHSAPLSDALLRIMIRLMRSSKATGVISLMEHPRCACNPGQPHLCNHDVSSFATPELRELASMPHVSSI
eukprot:8728544-Karenia_brevis.AAC.1